MDLGLQVISIILIYVGLLFKIVYNMDKQSTAIAYFQSVDFDLRLNDYRRLQILLENPLVSRSHIVSSQTTDYDGSMNDPYDVTDKYSMYSLFKNNFSRFDLSLLDVQQNSSVIQSNQYVHIRYKQFENPSDINW
jgi:hypothetical protein